MYVRKNCHLFMQRLGLHWPYRGRGLPVETKICSVNRGRLSHHLCGIKDFFSCSSDKTMTQAKSPICFNTGEPPTPQGIPQLSLLWCYQNCYARTKQPCRIMQITEPNLVLDLRNMFPMYVHWYRPDGIIGVSTSRARCESLILNA